MSNTDKVFGKGTELAIGGTTVCALTNISFPGFSADDIDVTSHCTTDYFKEYIKGLTDAGEIAFEGHFTYTDYGTVYAGLGTQSLYSVTVAVPTTPSETQFLANAYVKSLSGGAPHNDKINASGSLKISGKPTLQQV